MDRKERLLSLVGAVLNRHSTHVDGVFRITDSAIIKLRDDLEELIEREIRRATNT
jgi:hypothetical protein